MTKRTVSVLTLSVLAVLSMTASAEQVPATVRLAQVAGNVMVNDGARFVKAASGAQVKPGTKIVASKDATLDLVYQNGCVKRVKANTMLTVGTQEECVAKISNERIYVAAAGGGGGIVPGRGFGLGQFLMQNPIIPPVVAGVGVGVGAAATNSGGNNNKIIPVSP